MSFFYQPPTNQRLLLYSERGLVSYLFHVLLVSNLDLVLDRATDLHGRRLRDVAGNAADYRLVTEFDLGKAGFGCPDGGILIGPGEPEPCFVFVEAKLDTFDSNFLSPQAWAWVQNQSQQQHGWQQVRKKISGFNSGINGQLELRWRFVNALLTAGGGTVTEHGVSVNQEIVANDVFYLRCGMSPNPLRAADWRYVDLPKLPALQRVLQAARRFVLLSITGDQAIPQRLRNVRLFDRQGQPLANPLDHLFWMPMGEIERQLTRL